MKQYLALIRLEKCAEFQDTRDNLSEHRTKAIQGLIFLELELL